MSISASFDLRVVQAGGKKLISQLETIEMLIDYGWSPLRNGNAYYLPIGDIDTFAWTGGPISLSELLEILKEKEKRSELIGVTLTWKNTEFDGDLLVWSEKAATKDNIHTPLSFTITANRKTFFPQENYEIIDVNWYLEKLLPAFNRDNVYVEYFTYEQHV